MTETVATRFDELVRSARSSEAPSRLDALYRALFGLDQWLFVADPRPGLLAPRPYRGIHEGKAWYYVFTDEEHLQRFAEANGFARGPTSGPIAVTVDEAVERIAEDRGVDGVHFNEGEDGWFLPRERLPEVQRHLRSTPPLQTDAEIAAAFDARIEGLRREDSRERNEEFFRALFALESWRVCLEDVEPTGDPENAWKGRLCQRPQDGQPWLMVFTDTLHYEAFVATLPPSKRVSVMYTPLATLSMIAALSTEGGIWFNPGPNALGMPLWRLQKIATLFPRA